MIESAELRGEAQGQLPPVDPAREAAAARALLPYVEPGAAALELGCGAGWSSLLLAARIGRSRGLIAWDPAADARALAAAHAARAGLAAQLTVVDEPPSAPAFELVVVGARLAACDAAFAAALRLADARLRPGGRVAVTLPADRAGRLLPWLHAAGYVPRDPTQDHRPIVTVDDLEPAPGSGEHALLLRRTDELTGLPVTVHRDAPALLAAYGFDQPGLLLEHDLDEVTNDCERHGRRRRDAEVLCGLAHNRPGPCLDLGTSHGRSAFKLATNVAPHVVTTVNMLPEQAAAAGVHVTHVLTREQIGSYPRERGVRNIRQLYANTLAWDWRPVPGDLQLAFVDACHDAAAVLADSLQCWRRLRPGGFLVWHDFSPALAAVHPWIATSMAGVRAFVERVRPTARLHHLLGSWCGVLRKEAGDG